MSARYSRLVSPPDSLRTTSTSSRDSDACVWTSTWSLARQRRHRLEQLARAGDSEARRERRAQTAVRRAVPAACERDALVDRRRVVSCSRAGACGVESIMHLPTSRAARLAERLEHHIRVVHGLHRQHRRRAARAAARRRRAAPRRAASPACARPRAARRAAAATPAAAGRRRTRGTASGRGGCASARSPGGVAAARVDDGSCALVDAADRGDPPSRTETSPSTMSRRRSW